MVSKPIEPIPKSLRGKTCYACPKQATTMDHVPPQFLFPEQEDLGHKYGNLRLNLITVPACKQHNTEQSGDDTYFTIFVVTNQRNNEIAQDYFSTKIERTIDKDPQVARWYAEAIYGHGPPIKQVGRLDRVRFDRCVNKIVKGLYYKITGRKILAATISGIHYPDLFLDDPRFLFFKRVFEREYSQHDRYFVRYPSGSPRVFSAEYFLDIAQPHRFVFKMKFYEGFRVWVVNDDPVLNTAGIQSSVQGSVRQ